MRTLTILLISCVFISCNRNCEKRGEHETVTYVNNSTRSMKYLVVNNYPDTTWPVSFKSFPKLRDLAPYSSYEEKAEKGKCIESSFRNLETYWVYFIDADSFRKYEGPWNAYIHKNVLLERRAVNLQYLRESDCVITYSE